MELTDKIYIAGHTGMVGSAIFRNLDSLGYQRIITRTSRELDLRNQQAVADFFKKEKPEYIFLAAAKAGGIYANDCYRAEFLYDNMMIEANIVHAAYQHSVKKLLFPGSSCIYPRLAPQPLKEEYLLSGLLEKTNEPYAIAKIAGIKLCEAYRDQYGCNFIAVMPPNLYGEGDNYHPTNSHVIPGLIRKFHEAKMQEREVVEIWGSGTAEREFMYVDDLADACVFLMQHYDAKSFINAGSGTEISIRNLAELIREIVGFEGELTFNISRPEGTPRKIMDSSKIRHLGWKSKISLRDGLERSYTAFRETRGSICPGFPIVRMSEATAPCGFFENLTLGILSNCYVCGNNNI